MFFVTRDFVCERLGISSWASYNIFSASRTHMINSDSVVELLNRSRRGKEAEVDYIPSDLVTSEELESKTGIPSRKFITWSRRKKMVIPHYRINKQTTRFRLSSVEDWLKRG